MISVSAPFVFVAPALPVTPIVGRARLALANECRPTKFSGSLENTTGCRLPAFRIERESNFRMESQSTKLEVQAIAKGGWRNGGKLLR